MPTAARSSRSFALRPWMVVLVANLIFLAVIFLVNGSTIYEFIYPRQGGGVGGLGYDGQFTYWIARDPGTAAAAITDRGDIPAYRFQRILHAALSRLFSLGQEPLIPYAMVAIALAFLVIGTWAMEQLLIDIGVSRWYALTYGLFGGVFMAVRMTTTESLAFGLALLAILAGQRSKLLLQAVLFAIAALAKEPTLFFAAGYVLYFAANRRWRAAIRLAVISVVPFILWQVYLYLYMGSFGVGSGGQGATRFEIIPFNGIWQISQHSMQLFLALGFYLVIGTVIPTVYALIVTIRDLLRRKWDNPWVFLLFVNALVIPPTPFSTYREPSGIVRFIPGLVISFVLYTAYQYKTKRIRRPLQYSTMWILWGLVLLA